MILFLNSAGAPNGGQSILGMTLPFVVMILVMYFLLIRPQKKEEQKKIALMESLAVGDSVLTTAGFYGVIIDMTSDTVIVEFGNNKNCRIPMQKAAILKSEKPNYKNEDTDKK